MGAHRKESTGDAKIDAAREYQREYDKKRRSKIEKPRSEMKNPGKKIGFNDYDGFVCLIETLNRTTLNTIILSMTVNYGYKKGVNWIKIRGRCLDTINAWLRSQSDYDRTNKIFIFDSPEDTRSNYQGEFRSFDLQIYLKRLSKAKDWNTMYTEIVPLMEELKAQIRIVAEDEEMNIIRRLPNNRKLREKVLEAEEVPNGA